MSAWCIRDGMLILLKQRGEPAVGTSRPIGVLDGNRRMSADELLRGQR